MGRLTEAMRRAAEDETGRGTAPAGSVTPGAESDRANDAPGAGLKAVPTRPLEDGWTFEGDAPAMLSPDGEPEPLAEAPATVTARTAAKAPDPDPDASLFDRVDMQYAQKVVVDHGMAPASREQYRRLAAALHHAQEQTGIRVVMISSALPGEGKTLTASNLALTLSESYHRQVLLIDGDLRKPSLHGMFTLAASPGLTEGLAASASRLPLRQISRHLTVLTAGAPSGDPMAGLTSTRMRDLVDEARRSFDWVIIDTSPIGLLTDASLLGAMVDGIVMVVRAGSTPHDLVHRAIESLGVEKVIGVVLNQAEVEDQPYGGAYGYRGYGGAYASVPNRGA
ncbi:MAG: CpsD/CapB family tyrosine-protein kinase [Vicinamibacterales bacterium]